MTWITRVRPAGRLLIALGAAASFWSAAPAIASETDGAGEPPAIESPFGAYLAGLAAKNLGDDDVAADYMLTALNGAPGNLAVLRPAFLLVAGEGRQEEAVALARRLQKLEESHVTANLVLSMQAAGEGNWDEATAFIENLPERGLGGILKPMLSAWIALGEGDAASAKERLAPLKNDSGIEFLYYMHLGLIEEIAGNDEAAGAAYEAAAAETRRPPLRLAWLAGNFHERGGRPEQAIPLYRAILEQNRGGDLMLPLLQRAESGDRPADLPVPGAREGLAEVLFNFASLLVQEQATDLALVTVQQALRLHDDLIAAKVLLGEIYQGQQRGAAAIDAYRRVDTASPFAWLVRLRIADELDALDRVDDALAELDALAEERPASHEPHSRKGNLLRARDRFEEAVVAYDAAFERLPDLRPPHWTLLYFRGVALERAQQWDRAEADFLKALELSPEQPFVMNYLAYSWVEQKRHLDEAQGMLERAVELRPDDGYIVDSLGWVYYRLANYEGAVKYLERAVELRPQDPVINDHLGDALWRTGRQAEARFQWRRALSLEPEEDRVKDIENKIKSGMDDAPQDI